MNLSGHKSEKTHVSLSSTCRSRALRSSVTTEDWKLSENTTTTATGKTKTRFK